MLDNGACDGQSDAVAGSVLGTRSRIVGAKKRFEYRSQMGIANTGPAIGNRNSRRAGVARNVHIDSATGGAETDGVPNHVFDGALQQRRFCENGRRRYISAYL